MTKKEFIEVCKNTIGVDFEGVDLSKIETRDLVAELRSRQEVTFHYLKMVWNVNLKQTHLMEQ